MMEYAVKHGQQVFAISWRNPTERHADWDLDTYAGAVLEALEAVEEITGADKTHVMGLCAGGIVLSTVVAHLAAKGEQDRIAGMTLGVTVLDQHNAGTTGAFMGANTAMAATADSARKGYLERALARGRVRLAAPERPDLELLGLQLPDGQDPAGVRHPVLERRRDEPAGRAAPRLPATSRSRTRSRSRARRRCSAPRSTSRRSRSTRYVVAGIADHITPWQNAYRTVNLLGASRASCSPRAGTSPRWSTRRATRRRRSASTTELPEEPEAWLESASTTPGTLVGRLGGVAGRALGRREDGPQDARRPGPQAARRRAGQLRARVGVPRVRVNGVPLHYERSGAGEPLLLITGFTISAAVFEPVLDLYGGRFECITYDNRGSGRSGAPLRPTSMAELAADAAGLLRALGIDERARLRALDGRHDRPGARDPLPRARARARARRDHAGRPAGGAADAARARRAGRRRRGRVAPSRAPWLGAWVFSRRRSGASSPSACASCCATSAATARRRRASGRTGGRPSTTTRVSRLERIQAPTLVMHGEPDAMAPDLQRAPARRADPRRRAGDRARRRARLPARAPGGVLRAARATGWTAAPRSPPATPRGGLAARAEPLTRALGLPIGAARTGASLAGSPHGSSRPRGSPCGA